MLPLPASATKVLEALHVPAEKRAHLRVADAAHRVLQERVNLNLLAELLRPQLHKSSPNSFNVAVGAVKDHSSGANRVLVLIWKKKWLPFTRQTITHPVTMTNHNHKNTICKRAIIHQKPSGREKNKNKKTPSVKNIKSRNKNGPT
jgi:hypothetical protein